MAFSILLQVLAHLIRLLGRIRFPNIARLHRVHAEHNAAFLRLRHTAGEAAQKELEETAARIRCLDHKIPTVRMRSTAGARTTATR